MSICIHTFLVTLGHMWTLDPVLNIFENSQAVLEDNANSHHPRVLGRLHIVCRTHNQDLETGKSLRIVTAMMKHHDPK